MAHSRNSLHIAGVIKGGKLLGIGIAGLKGTSKICKCATSRHAEMDVLYKLRKHNLNKSTIYSVRYNIDKNTHEIQSATMAKPCLHCKQLIKKRGIKKIIYTNWEGEYIQEHVDYMSSVLSTGSMISINKKKKY